LKNGVFWDVTPCGSCKNDVSEDPGASFIRVTRIGELGITQAATSDRRKLRRNWYFFAAYVGLFTLFSIRNGVSETGSLSKI
jgi:hypothetical protein